MYDLLTNINNYDFSKHSYEQNSKNVANYMVQMKALTISVGKKHALKLDANFINAAKDGKITQSDYDKTRMKQRRSQYVKLQMEAGQDRKRALNDWDYMLKEIKSK